MRRVEMTAVGFPGPVVVVGGRGLGAEGGLCLFVMIAIWNVVSSAFYDFSFGVDRILHFIFCCFDTRDLLYGYWGEPGFPGPVVVVGDRGMGTEGGRCLFVIIAIWNIVSSTLHDFGFGVEPILHFLFSCFGTRSLLYRYRGEPIGCPLLTESHRSGSAGRCLHLANLPAYPASLPLLVALLDPETEDPAAVVVGVGAVAGDVARVPELLTLLPGVLPDAPGADGAGGGGGEQKQQQEAKPVKARMNSIVTKNCWSNLPQ